MTTTITRQGALFAAEEGVTLDDIAHFERLAAEGALPTPISTFAATVLGLCCSDPDRRTDQVTLCRALKISRATSLRRCSALAEMGLMTKTSVPVDKRRPVTLYTLHHPSHLNTSAWAPPVAYDSPLPSVRPEDASELVSQGRGHRQVPWKGDSLAVFRLFAALPSVRAAKKPEQSFEVNLRAGPHETSTLRVIPPPAIPPNVPHAERDDPDRYPRLLCIEHLRVYIVLIAMAYDYYHNHGGDIDGVLTVRNNTILQALKLPKETGHKRFVHGAIRSLEATGFEWVFASDGLRDKYPGQIHLLQTFRLLSSIAILSYYGGGKKVGEEFSFTLPRDLVARIKNHDVLTVHPEIMAETNPLAIKLYIWSRRAVRHDHQGRPWDLSWVCKEIERSSATGEPMTPLRRMRMRLKTLLEERQKEGEPYTRIAGYLITYNADRDTITVRADKDDWLLGERSFFQTKRREEEAGVSAKDECTPASLGIRK